MKRHTIATAALTAAFTGALLAAPSHAADLVVGPAGSGADHATIQAAIDAATPGDTLLILPGTYARFDLDKPLRLIGAGSGQVLVDEPDASRCAEGWMAARVSNVPAGTQALVAGMTFQAPSPPTLYASCFAARIAHNDGMVVLHDVRAASPLAALDVHDSEFVFVSSSTFRALHPAGSFLPGHWSQGAGLRVTDSNVWIGDSVLEGLGAATGLEQVFGHEGLKVINSNVFLARSQVAGGDGGLAPFGACGGQSGYQGAAGVLVAGSSMLRIAGGPNDVIRAGEGGQLGACSGAGASAIRVSGPGVVYRHDTVALQPSTTGGAMLPETELSGGGTEVLTNQVLPSLGANVSSGVLDLKLSGVAGWHATLFVALSPSPPLAFSGVDGSGALDPTSLLFQVVGTLDAQGDLVFQFPLPNQAALAGTSVYFQWMQKQPGGAARALSNPATVVL